MPSIHTFDVFDTALVRTVAQPGDIFRLIAERIWPDNTDVDRARSMREDFISARVEAERTSRQNCAPRQDCSLADIWDELKAKHPSLPAEANAELEEAVERDNIVANPAIAKRIGKLRAQGKRVIFISDIYHSRSFVFGLLHQAGLVADIADVYVSSEFGSLKATGRLFVEVAACEGVQPSAFEHTGDNPRSDFASPRALGATATLYPDARLNPVEEALLRAGPRDIGCSRLVATMRLARLASPRPRGSIVTALLGPLAVVLAAWSLGEATRSGAAKLYYVARDGYVPWLAAAAMREAFPEVESRYIQLSRHSLVAAVPQLGEFGVFWIQQSWSGHSLAEIAGLTGHDWSDIEPALHDVLPDASGETVLSDIEDIRAFVAVLDASRHGPDRVKLSQGVLAYLRGEGMLDDAPFLIFDVGWYLNLQAALKAVLTQNAKSGFQAEFQGGFQGGLYLGLSLGRVSEALAGPARALAYEEPYSLDLPEGANQIFDRRILVEHLLGLAPHGTARGYRAHPGNRVQVIEGPIDETRKETASEIAEGICSFAALAAPFARALAQENLAERLVMTLFRHVFEDPAPYDLTALKDLTVEADSGKGVPSGVVEPWRGRTILLQCIPYRVRVRLGLNHGPTFWPEASRANSGRTQLLALDMVKGTRRFLGRVVQR